MVFAENGILFYVCDYVYYTENQLRNTFILLLLQPALMKGLRLILNSTSYSHTHFRLQKSASAVHVIFGQTLVTFSSAIYIP